MKHPRRQFLRFTAVAAALPAVSRIARAQAYPTRPVRILVGFAAGAQAASSGEQPMKLEHMDYSQARKIILRQGWKPLTGGCRDPSQTTCDHFPEIDICSSVWPAPCAMSFVRQDKCLLVTTSGGEPVDDMPGDTHVEYVTVDDGPCAKN